MKSIQNYALFYQFPLTVLTNIAIFGIDKAIDATELRFIWFQILQKI